MEIDTPYKLAKQQWDKRLGQAQMQVRFWSASTLFLLCITGALSFGIISLLDAPRVVPHIIEVDKNGSAEYLGSVYEQRFQITEKHVRHYLFRFLEYVRSLSSDIVVVKQNWKNAYYFLTPAGAEILTTYARDIDPLTRFKTERVDIKITSVLEHSQYSRQVNWIETIWDKNGKIIDRSSWRGLFKIELRPINDPVLIKYNPLGFFIDAFNWTKVEVE